MSYYVWTATYCDTDPGCDRCNNEREIDINYEGEDQVQAESAARATAPAGKVLCRLRGHKEKSWYDDPLGLIGTGCLIILVIVALK